jgi:peptidoglycan/LPS O-acetylase OafA/YrhL
VSTDEFLSPTRDPVYSPTMITNRGQRTAPPDGKRAGRGGRLYVLDGVRLVAALMVALYHFTAFDPGVKPAWGSSPVQAFPDLHRFTQYGWMGVELFFVISGFVICMSSWGRTVGDFFRSRVTRLFPAYWPAVLITTAVVAIWPSVKQPLRVNEVLVNLTMLNEPLGIDPVDGVYWSLWAEARFYLLFGAALLFRSGGLTLRRVLIFGYSWTIASVLAVSADEPLLRIVFQPEFSPLFIAGIAFYLIHRFGSDIRLWGLIAASFVLAAHNAVIRVELVGRVNLHRDLSPTIGVLLIFSYFVIMAVIALGWTSRVKWRQLTTAGVLTYPLYLLHEEIGWVMIHGLRDLRPRWLTLFLVLATMLLAAWLLHRLFEKPVVRWLKAQLAAAGTKPTETPRLSRSPASVTRGSAVVRPSMSGPGAGVAARGGADDGGESGDEAARVGPSAGLGDPGGVVALGEQDQRVANPQLGAPVIERHAEFVVEQTAERTGAGSDLSAEYGQ